MSPTMKEQWIQQMQEKLAGYRQPAPDVSWDEIEKALAQNRRKARAKMVQMWTRRIAAAAAMVLALVAIGYLAQDQQEAPANHDKVEAVVRTLEPARNSRENIVTQPVTTVQSSFLKTAVMGTTGSLTENVSAGEYETSAPQTQESTESVLQESSTPEVKETTVPVEKESTTPAVMESPKYMPLDYPTDIRKPQTSGNRLMAKVYLTNGAMTGANNNISDERTYHFGYSEPGTEPETKPLSHYASAAAKEDATHRLPVRYGLSLRYRLSNRWSIESGLAYTRLHSDISAILPVDNHTDMSVTSNIEQTLSYIGIPVNLSYQLWGSRYASLYVTAGGMAEKMVKGRLHLEENEDQHEMTESVSVGPLQFSMNGALGAELNLTPHISIYAEPGLGYYFDNGSCLRTYYQDHPFSFNLNVGLKFSFK